MLKVQTKACEKRENDILLVYNNFEQGDQMTERYAEIITKQIVEIISNWS